MFNKINLVNELKSIAAQNRTAALQEAEEALKSVSEFLEKEDQETFGMLHYFGYSKFVSKAVENKERIERTTAQTKVFKSMDCLTAEDIKIVCEKYYLKFLPAEQYNMPVPAHALQSLRDFAKTTDMGKAWGPSRGIDPEKLFIIGPPSHFKLMERPEPEDNDPVLLYMIEDGIFMIITQWGNDFTLVRRIYGALNKFLDTWYMLLFVAILIIYEIVSLWNVVEYGDKLILIRAGLIFVGFFGFLFIVSSLWKAHMEYDSPYKN